MSGTTISCFHFVFFFFSQQVSSAVSETTISSLLFLFSRHLLSNWLRGLLLDELRPSALWPSILGSHVPPYYSINQGLRSFFQFNIFCVRNIDSRILFFFIILCQKQRLQNPLLFLNTVSETTTPESSSFFTTDFYCVKNSNSRRPPPPPFPVCDYQLRANFFYFFSRGIGICGFFGSD